VQLISGWENSFAMANKQDQEIRAQILFICQEIDRIRNLNRKDLSENDRWDCLASIPSPRGGTFPWGQKALKKVDEISEAALKMHNLLGRISNRELRDKTGLVVTKAIFASCDNGQDIEVKPLLSEIGKAAKLLCKDTSFLFPCHLMTAKKPDSFVIGPVRFMNRQTWQKLIVEKIRSKFFNSDKSETHNNRKLIARSVRHYRRFQWVAEVQVKNASNEVGEKIARSLVNASLDCLHLMFGGQRSHNMRIGSDAPERGRSAKLSVASNGELHGSVRYAGQGHVNFGDDWWDKTNNNLVAAQVLNSHSQLISLLQSGIENRPIAVRFLDAAQWFGESARDSHDASKIVKIITSLERLLIAKQPNEIAETLAKRVSAICKLGFDEKRSNEFYEDAKNAYNLRSRLIHGDRSPNDNRIKGEVFDCQELAEKTLRSALLCFHSGGLFSASTNTTRFEKFLNDVVDRGNEALPAFDKKDTTT
jgi:hypothetical protein